MAELTARAPRSLPVVPSGVPAHVTSHASGGRDLWSPPLERRPADPVAGLYELLGEVLDPELPVSLVDLGLIYGARLKKGTAHIDLTFTATACPCMDFIRDDITERLLREHWIERVEIQEVWNPPWTRDRITEAGRRRLRTLGVGV